MFRIYFEAGQRALADYDIKHDMLTDLSNRYSSSVEDFPSKLKAQEEKTAALKDELFHLKKSVYRKTNARGSMLSSTALMRTLSSTLSEHLSWMMPSAWANTTWEKPTA